MEENSEAHMETDVSSTTEDVPETQEVTGSHHDVEMVIVVEKIKEEEVNSSTPPIKQSLVDNKVEVVSVTKSPQKEVPKIVVQSPKKDGEAQKSNKSSPSKPELPQKSVTSQKSVSPQNSVTSQKPVTPQKSVTPQKLVTKETQPVKTIPVIRIQAISNPETIVDSSCKTDAQEVENKTNNLAMDTDNEIETSTPKSLDLDPLKGLEILPTKDVSDTDNMNKPDNTEKQEDPNKITQNTGEELSNDSQQDLNSDASNKSISRELRSLINSAKESKIISECTQLTSKTRKSRTALDSSSNSLNVSMESEKIQARRSSNNSQMSNCSEKSDKTAIKRSMRSQNPEFVNKVKHFLNSVTGKIQKDSDASNVSDEELDEKVRDDASATSTPKKKKPSDDPLSTTSKLRTDPYCWRCHWAIEQAANEKTHAPQHCTVCPRAFHFKCLTGVERSKINVEKNWVCPECMSVLHAESSETRSPAMKKISLGMLCELLKHALERMMDVNGVEPFLHPVDRSSFPDYDKYVVHPMDLTLMKENITVGLYGSTEAFLADAQWILHNSIIFNTLQSKLTGGARALVRSCRAEMGEIEACPECYAAAHARRPTWFTDVCSTPHILLWAKLKGFPYWPAKGMSVNGSGLVDVRFFGAHDRAWVPAKDCFLYSEKDPNNFRTKRQDILDSMQEAEQHIRNISRRYGKFVYPPFKTQFDPSKLNEQLKMMIPSFEGEVQSPVKNKLSNSSPNTVKNKSRSNSKSSKGSGDGDTSEGEDNSAVQSRKMADGAVIARDEDDTEKDKTMEVEETSSKDNDQRKRRRSELEEAVITILDSNGSKEKRRRVESVDKAEEKKTESQDANKDPGKKETQSKETEKPINDKIVETKTKENDSANVAEKEKSTPKATPVKPAGTPKTVKTVSKPNTPKDNTDKNTPQRRTRDKSSDKTTKQDEKSKTEKRRNSRNKSLNSSNVAKADKKTDNTNKDKAKENSKSTESDASKSDKAQKPSGSDSPKPMKDRIQFDDDTSLAVIARESAKNNVITTTGTGLPTISSVRSLSTTAQSTPTTTTKTNATTSNRKIIEVTIDTNSDASIFTPTSTDNVRNMKEAVNKLQKLRSDTDQPVVGRVGVRSFARMTSPPEKDTPNDVQVEIKAEPMDFDDADRQAEKMNLMTACKLRPVNPTASSLREVRINKVVVTPLNAKKTAAKAPEVRPRAKKTFPQPKKPEEGRSELNGKNSMVYIPIQPPMTQAPVRPGIRPVTNGTVVNTPPVPRLVAPTANSVVNTVTPPLIPMSIISTMSSPTATVSSVTSAPTIPLHNVPAVGQVHTVPLITSVNGQWTLNLQPVMSVGAVDNASSPPMLNGLPERAAPTPLIPVPTPAILPAPAIAPAATRNNTETPAPGEPPRLQQRPALLNPLDASTPIGNVPPPSTAGPLTAKLNQNAVKLTDFFRTLLEDSLEKLDEPASQLTTLRLQLEQAKWRHQQEIDEMKHNHELTLAEMRASFEKEKSRVVSEARRTAQVELETAVKAAKSKQWCANCSQEAQFYCCWNTSYCDYPCQRAHWATHYALCTQHRDQDGNANNDGTSAPPENRLQPQPQPKNLPKSSSTPALTVGKLAPSRVYTQEQSPAPQKSSIIVSMVEGSMGNQTMMCVGTYKPPTPQLSPLIINKQLMTTEETTGKKVVTSGGYLIVGASASNATIVTPGRRTNTIQYYT